MSATFRLARGRSLLLDVAGRCFDPVARDWKAVMPSDLGPGEALDAIAAVAWLQRESGNPLRVPVGVIGPRDATTPQLTAAIEVGELLGDCRITVICGGRGGVMQAVCEGVARVGGLSVGLLPETDAAVANRFVGVPIATGIGEARNALIARASLCLVAVGNSHGTLSEVALSRHFGKLVVGLADAARVEGVRHVDDASAALVLVAQFAAGQLEPAP
jgi:uncharacterized protein (TIGR00725 family)